MRIVDPARLPEDTLPRLKALVELSAPDPHKPLLPAPVETLLRETDSLAAGMWAELEELTYRTQKLAEDIRRRRT